MPANEVPITAEDVARATRAVNDASARFSLTTEALRDAQATAVQARNDLAAAQKVLDQLLDRLKVQSCGEGTPWADEVRARRMREKGVRADA